eukprot:snap_masked-scaffold_15-processed-gene-2.42-mRNA-1 protein AED:0.45 eAED:0.47 QI:0/-1/0/1/-1/1/1/0/661
MQQRPSESIESLSETKNLGPPLDDSRFGGLKYVGEVDNLYQEAGPEPFEFNAEVVNVFDDMVSRSVPLYREVNDYLLYWVHKYYFPGKHLLDLGCSTGTTLDLICRSFVKDDGRLEKDTTLNLVGIDNSHSMIERCEGKLSWTKKVSGINIETHTSDILSFFNSTTGEHVKEEKYCFVIMNYTLQFIPYEQRLFLLEKLYSSLSFNGILFISEKIRFENADLQRTSTEIYEDFKHRRGYSKSYIARKKEALHNVLVSYTEKGLREVLVQAGFNDEDIILAMKWNNFSTFIARKRKPEEATDKEILSKALDVTGRFYNKFHLEFVVPELTEYRCEYFSSLLNGIISRRDKIKYRQIAAKLEKMGQQLSALEVQPSWSCIDCTVTVNFSACGVTKELQRLIFTLVDDLKPWKKGPFEIIFSKDDTIFIDSEWRSNLKWKRLIPFLPKLDEKSVCDIGCNNGYFMFQMLKEKPKIVLGIEPNLNAFFEFKLFETLISGGRGLSNLFMDVAKADIVEKMNKKFDVVFCLGVLYHTTDPIKMLRDIHQSLNKGGVLIVDCQGVRFQDSEYEGVTSPLCLFPKSRYAKMKGVYFVPNLQALKNWLNRASFTDVKVIFDEKLEEEEQRISTFAPVNSSLKESLDASNPDLTVEGYPAPRRFYIKARKG